MSIDRLSPERAERNAAATDQLVANMVVNYFRLVMQRSEIDFSFELANGLDVGCGDGHFACELARWGAHMVGIDAEPRKMAEMAIRMQVEYMFSMPYVGQKRPLLLQANAQQMPFSDASFDFVSSLLVHDTYHYDQNQVSMNNEIARVLKPGGLLFFLHRHILIEDGVCNMTAFSHFEKIDEIVDPDGFLYIVYRKPQEKSPA